jgi:hypothetical protein
MLTEGGGGVQARGRRGSLSVTRAALMSRFEKYEADFEAIVSTLKSAERLRQP